jgi:two-component system, response regulator YesN
LNHSWYNRLLISYMPIFIIVPSLLLVIFYFGSAELSQKETAKANEVFSRQAVQSLDYSFRAISEMMNREIISNEFEPFFSDTGNPYIAAHNASTRLIQLKLSNPLIDSLYLYRLSDKVVLSHQSISPLEQFSDRGVIERAVNGPVPTGWSEPRNAGSSPEVSHMVVTLIRSIPLITGEKGVMVVNVSADALRNLLRDMIGNEISFIHLYDANSRFLLGTENGLQAEEGAALIPPNQKQELSRVVSTYTGWQIRSGMVGGSFLQILLKISFIWIVMVILIITVGLGWLVLVSRRNYKPVATMMQRISSMTGKRVPSPAQKTGNDEFSYIESTLSEIIQASDEYRKQQKEDIIYKRRHFFHELLEGSRTVTRDEWRQELPKYGLEPDFRQLAVGLLEIDRFTDFSQAYTHKSQELLRYALVNALGELCHKRSLAVWPEWLSNGQMGMLFLITDTAQGPDFDKTIMEVGQELIVWVEANLTFTVTMSSGGFVAEVSDIYRSYDDAMEAMKYKSVLGRGRFIGQKDIGVKSDVELYKGLQTIRSLAQTYRLGDPQWEEQFEALFGDLKTGLLSRDELLNIMNYLIYHLFREMMELPGEMQEIWRQEAAPGLNDALERFETMEELHADFKKLLEDNARKLRMLRQSKSSHGVIQEVKRYIEEHYSDPNMSLSLISEQFQISTSYLSRLFKDEFGENFVDYLAQVRIGHAQQLLKETRETIHEIASRVGYTNYISFNRAFKKVTSTTPGEYRSQEGA